MWLFECLYVFQRLLNLNKKLVLLIICTTKGESLELQCVQFLCITGYNLIVLDVMLVMSKNNINREVSVSH